MCAYARVFRSACDSACACACVCVCGGVTCVYQCRRVHCSIHCRRASRVLVLADKDMEGGDRGVACVEIPVCGRVCVYQHCR